ncbi:hypothetical protein [Pseudorhodoplanes sp.]|jgi:hypothetical protein|uniref:hypothetical protein n=1 Tax=Pseudorhodoplanes sp. TaxID=1934341 RepID=UPI002CDEF27D|nr:hypothetical protein [Pseudorhodoplanes sp.]HWV41224.1 hypothetical protein [Pseudorhodoplanes sp.]
MDVHEQHRRPAPRRSPVRRIAAAIVLSALLFGLLWLAAVGFVTSLLIASGCCVVVIAASSVLDVIEMILDAIAAVIFGIFAAIAALFAALFALFGF